LKADIRQILVECLVEYHPGIPVLPSYGPSKKLPGRDVPTALALMASTVG
jgi:hypothetical protein